MILSDIFGFKKPETTDNATAATDISANAALAESVSKHNIAVQTNSSTTTYLSDFPLKAYTDGHSFIFIPLYSCSGAATININSLGTKKLYLEDGITQISFEEHFEIGIQYLLVYESLLNSGAGAFKVIRLSPEIPAGQVNYYAMSTAPSGWLECNGGAISRATYSRLFRKIGVAFGAGNGSTTFNLPDLRAEFIRGWDHGRGVDTDRVFGSFQNGTAFGDRFYASLLGDADTDGTVTVNDTGMGGSATLTRYRVRPRNVALLPCIKY